MKEYPKFTFTEESGHGVCDPYVCINLGEYWIGTIDVDEYGRWGIKFKVCRHTTKEHPRPYKWGKYPNRFEDKSLAIAFVEENNERIQDGLKLYFGE